MKYIAFCPVGYALDIMRPLQAEARRRGDEFAWFTLDGLHQKLNPEETWLASMEEVQRYQADAVFSPVHWVPHQFPGAKVQVFHGFDIDKHGDDDHFRLRGCFDLLLTQGPSTTQRFSQMADELGYFQVVETGWAKLDPLFDSTLPARPISSDKPVVFYASTFSRKVCSIEEMLPTLHPLMASGNWHFLLSTHPKTDAKLADQLQQAAKQYAQVDYVRDEPLIPALKAAEIMLCDTSSIVYEFLLLQRPAITLRNAHPGPHLIDIARAQDLEKALLQALSPEPALKQSIVSFGQHIHPYRDGCSAQRSLDAVEQHVATFVPRKRKPLSLYRRWKTNQKLKRGLRKQDQSTPCP